jgi:hypothetical protein
VLCRPMMDLALNRLEAARPEIVKRLPTIQQSGRLDEFEAHLRISLLAMYAEPNQPLLRDLRIAVGKLVADCAHVILQSADWQNKYRGLWGILRIRVVADHKWLYQAGCCQRNPVIMHGFENMDILWCNDRGQGWQPAVDVMFPLNLLSTLPKPPPLSATEKTAGALPTAAPRENLAPRPGAMSRGRVRARGAPTGLVEPAPQPARGQGKQAKKTEAPEKSAARAVEEAGLSSPNKATQDATGGDTTEADPSTAVAQGIDSSVEDSWSSYWANISTQYSMLPMILNLPPPSYPPARSSSEPPRPSSSSSALSARAEPFQPGDSLPSAGSSSSTREPTSDYARGESQASIDYTEDPTRLAELYGSGDNQPRTSQDKGKGKEVTGSTTPASSSKQSDHAETTEGQSSSEQDTAAELILDLSSLGISEKDDDDDWPLLPR